MTRALMTTSFLSWTAFAFVLASSASAGSPDGAIAWTRGFSGVSSDFPPALGPDGTVYSGNGGMITALAPDGAELWSVSANQGRAPISVGADGTIYTAVGAIGANPIILALNPDGTERWTFNAGSPIHAGPNVGPDGNIYAVADAYFGGIGMFSLTPEGQLRWSDQGDPVLSADTGGPHEIVFGANRALVAMATQGSGGGGGQPAAMWAFDFDGDQAFVLARSCQGQPVVNPLTGDLVTGNGICQAVQTYDMQSGELQWSVDPPSQSPCSGLATIAAGPDGAIYTAFCYRAFWSLDASGDERWFMDNFSLYFQMTRFGVAPDNSLVLELGSNVGGPGRARAFNPADGSQLWQVHLDLPGYQSNSRPTFDIERKRAYFYATNFSTQASALVALDLEPSPTSIGDIDGDQDLDADDRAMFCAVIGAATGEPGYMGSADLNDDGIIDHVDLAMLNALLPPCDGDVVTGTTFAPPPDGVTDGADLAYLLGAWGAQPSCADFVASRTFQPPPDGLVDGADLAYLLGAWGSCQ